MKDRKARLGFINFILLMVIVWGLTSGLATQVSAEDKALEISVEPGFEGKVKNGRWLPVQVTLNNPGGDLSGELAVQLSPPSGGKDVVYHTHVDVPKGSTRTITVDLPGMSYNKRNNTVQFYEGAIEKGKPVPIQGGSSYIETTLLADNNVRVGVLARDPDTLNFLALLSQKGYQVTTLPLKAEQLPAGGLALDQLDMLVINDFASDQLKPEQVKVIEAWVKRGGRLMLAGGAGYPKSAGPLEALSPVTYKGARQVSSLDQLVQLGGKPIVGGFPFTLSLAELREGNVLVGDSGTPLLASHAVGSGQVWYAAYDLSQQPVAAWSGNTTVWEHILAGLLIANPTNGGRPSPSFQNPAWEISNALDYFPSLKAPSFGILIIVILIYSLVIGPLLYMILKRVDRRGWAWFLIPAFALVCTLGVYGVGASGRSSTMAQSMRIVELDGQGSGTREEAASVFVPSGGTYDVELPGGIYPIPYNTEGGMPGNGAMNGVWDTGYETSDKQTVIRYKNVPYWSIRKVWADSIQQEQFGRFVVKLDYGSGNVSGQITNNTKDDLSNMSLLIFQQVILIGDLKVGETKTVNGTAIAQTNYMGMDIGGILFPYNGGSNDEHMQERAMINHLTNTKPFALGSEGPMIIGFSQKKVSDWMRVGGGVITVSQKTLFSQRITLDYSQTGKLQVPSGSILPTVSPLGTTRLDVNPHGINFVDKGEAVLEYQLPDIGGAVFSRLTSFNQSSNNSMLTYEIWNQKQQRWEPVDTSGALKEDGLTDYLIGARIIRLKVLAVQTVSMSYPSFTVEGAVR